MSTIDSGVLRRIGALALGQTATADDRVHPSVLHDTWAGALRRSAKNALPVELAQAMRLEDFDIFGFCVLTAPTVGDALWAAGAYFPLINGAGAWTLDLGATVARMTWHHPPALDVGSRASVESVVAHFAVGARRIAPTVRVRRAHFAHAATASRRALDALCGTTRFEAAQNALDFDRRHLAERNPRGSSEMHAHFRHHCDQALVQMAEKPSPFLAALHAQIERQLPSGETSADSIAAALATSRRTLHRRLKDMGTSYRRELERIRRRRAAELIEDPHLSLTSAAFELGYSDASSFSRAFRTWFGVAPREARQRQLTLLCPHSETMDSWQGSAGLAKASC